MQPSRIASRALSCLLVIALSAPLDAAAGLVPGACSGPLPTWECVGVLDIVSPAETLRLRFHDDERIVVEVIQPASTQRMLVAPDGVWYQGVPEGQARGRNPFATLPGAAMLPIGMLIMAFPDGPDTVPEQESTRELDFGHERIRISAARATDGTVRFSVSERGQALAHGTYRAGELPARPGGFDLTQWTRGELPRMQPFTPAN